MSTPKTFRVMAKCRNGHITNQPNWNNVRAGWLACDTCKAQAFATTLTVVDKPNAKCGVRCTSSLGPRCECSCGGERHGFDHH